MRGNFKADALIFDVDGVLLDVRESFPEVIKRAVMQGWEKYCGGTADCGGYDADLERVLKRHGAFNDDYDIAWTLLCVAAASGEKLLSRALPRAGKLAAEIADYKDPLGEWVAIKYGEAAPRREIRKLCSELYGTKGKGLHLLETPMLKRHWRELGAPAAIYSGRDTLEWELAKESLGWEDFPDELVIKSDSGITKPSPLGLEILCRRLGASSPVFFGDTASDMQAAEAFGRGRFAAIGALLPEAEFRYDTTEEAVADALSDSFD
ncbi:MAG: HAD family hydrolase [Synergistes jonesii]|uniref:HAD family hydrolase n=1 Tax=Synergistes jonesii TaxID=2754 RepID=UPI002A75EE2C|nr:HAD family hydrolase [Synergistes jonesii]MDY2985727.1 HAD family hydrolase [Synergistes jonesii]